jgi:hypothetical protein
VIKSKIEMERMARTRMISKVMAYNREKFLLRLFLRSEIILTGFSRVSKCTIP